jgi:hypothetical protein
MEPFLLMEDKHIKIIRKSSENLQSEKTEKYATEAKNN